jgi:hypothetical protein
MSGLIIVFSAIGGTAGSLITGESIRSLYGWTNCILFHIGSYRHFDHWQSFYISTGCVITLELAVKAGLIIYVVMEEQDRLFFIESLGALYEDVQSKGIFADSKYFVDSIPKYPVATIIEHYKQTKRISHAFDLAEFVKITF